MLFTPLHFSENILGLIKFLGLKIIDFGAVEYFFGIKDATKFIDVTFYQTFVAKLEW